MAKRERDVYYDFVVVGGGIAGVSCAQELARVLPEDKSIAILSATDVLKAVKNVVRITQAATDFDVYERRADGFRMDNPRIDIVRGHLARIDTLGKRLLLKDGNAVAFDKCCLCTGGRPHLILEHESVIGIHDTQSVEDFSQHLASARKVAVVGNGGVALELVHELTWCDVTWVLRAHYIGNTFFDAGASAFIAPALVERAHGGSTRPSADDEQQEEQEQSAAPHEYYKVKDIRTVHGSQRPEDATPEAVHVSYEDGGDDHDGEGGDNEERITGGALGPEWVTKTAFGRTTRAARKGTGTLTMEFGTHVIAVRGRYDREWISCDATEEEKALSPPHVNFEQFPFALWISNGKVVECDFMVSATGVVPETSFAGDEFERAANGGLRVNNHMQTTGSPDIYAAGDVCTVEWVSSPFWFQMRLWSQARTMAMYAAHCMAGLVDDELGEPFAFELFSHVTRFFGYKVVLLGKYNAQGMGEDVEKTVTEMVATPSGLVRQDQWREAAQGKITSLEQHTESHSESLRDNQVEILTRVTPGKEYIKLVLVNNRVVGALLIGDTELEETFENLIVNRLDVGSVKNDLLNPNIDIEDYFD